MKKFKGPYSASADDPGLDTGPGLTEQHHAESCDINKIIEKYTITGLLPQTDMEPIYGDFAEVGDFLDYQNRVIRAQEGFNQLDPAIRRRFNNDPAELMDFMANPQNRAEAEKLGLINSKPITPVSEQQSATKQNIPVNS